MLRLLLLTALFLSAFTGTSKAEEPVFARVEKTHAINCGYFVWPPYLIKDPNTGKMSGINYDIMEAIGKNLNIKINWTTEVGTGEVATALDSSKFDVACASLWPSPGRLHSMTMTSPTFYSPAYVFVRADDKRFDGHIEKANAKDIKVAVIDGDYSADLAKELLPNATVVALPMSASSGELLLQVVTKKADLVMCDEGVVTDFMKTNPNTFRKVTDIPPIRVYGELLSVKRGEYQLKDMINHAITQLADDGIISTILKKYEKAYGGHYFPPTPSYVVSKQ